MSYLNLIRYQNLIIIAMIQVFIRFGLFLPLGADITLSNFEFALLILATICLAAAGNIINDIYDVAIDKINKPAQVLIGKKISEKRAFNLFVVLNVIGVGIGFYLANLIGKPAFSALFILISALLYLYATYLKAIPLIGNIVISTLVALSLIIVGLFDLLPAINFLNQDYQSFAFRMVLDYAFFAFIINLIREIVKDIQDINGDKNGDMNTLPIAIGRKRASYVAFGIGIFTLFATIYYIYVHLYNYTIAILYFLLFIIAPLLYFCTKIWDAKDKSDYAFLSKLLKAIMLLGMCSILLYTFVIY